jgi:MFS family permease
MLMRNPQIVLIALAATLANSDYAFLEPTLGDHAIALGHARTEAGIGMLFSVASVTYTLACPLIGMLANRSVLLSALPAPAFLPVTVPQLPAANTLP